MTASPTSVQSSLRRLRTDLFDVDASHIALVKLLDQVQRHSISHGGDKELRDELRRAQQEISSLRHQLHLSQLRSQSSLPSEDLALDPSHTLSTQPSSSVASSASDDEPTRNDPITTASGNHAYRRDILIRAENESFRRELSAKKHKKRVSAWSQGSFDDGDGHYKRSIDYEPRERLGSAGTTNSGDGGSSSLLLGHESDSVSVLFGRDSIHRSTSNRSLDSSLNEIGADDASDHKSIRAHAERMLYWANKAAERNKSPSPDSVASGSCGSRPSVYYRHASVPTTIGLPPRGGGSKKTRSTLPPRPPSDGGSIGNTTHKSDKENGGSSFNAAVVGSSKRNNGDKAVIFNLDKVQSTEMCCQCSTSPFSSNDAHSEFYLPKLGLACACGGGGRDRDSFAENPTSLSNILREWQCDFLATLGLRTADQLLKAHRTRANDMSREMRRWREDHNLPVARSKECYVALMVWSRTAKVVLRSIEKQRENGEGPIEKPGFLDIACSDAYTVGSVSTLGQMSSVDGRVHEMMEI